MASLQMPLEALVAIETVSFLRYELRTAHALWWFGLKNKLFKCYLRIRKTL